MAAFVHRGLFSYTLSANSVRPNLRTLAISAGWDQASRVRVNITAALINEIALGTLSFPGGLELIIESGVLIGSDGTGAALSTSIPVTVTNNGTIAGVGGRGGNGETYYYNAGGVQYVNGGQGGDGQRFSTGSTTILAAQNGANGQSVNFDGFHTATGGKGGNGGTWGNYGDNGGYGTDSSAGIVLGSVSGTPQSGSAPGYAVSGNSNITWLATGTRHGAIT